MGISELVDAECEIIMRDLNLEDNGEIRNLVDFTCTVTLNDVSSWQLDMHTEDFYESQFRGSHVLARRWYNVQTG